MANKREITIPEPFLHAPFALNMPPKITEIADSFEENMIHCTFYYDICECLSIKSCQKPWNEYENYLPYILKRWSLLEEVLHDLYKDRKQKSQEIPMIEGFSLFIVGIHWFNSQPVKSLEQSVLNDLRFSKSPVNFSERVAFILNKPAQYHSYIQLKQLFEEFKKQFHKELVMKKLK
ncbi:YpoC family protein [Metabacillus arenae]|uniref:YpoC-like domain-containing protein n=1 Tax=Metabacillus arenae TaxID=2771434 RepID=A0A926NPQ3_9BACI|nr:hypothetical protein [Metabacillus arenae]MBD1381666.1 hypothetical protein [Metabacillus arenae]